MTKKIRTRVSDVTVTIDYGEYLVGYCYQVTVGNSLMATDIKFPTKPTDKQIRKLKKAWYREMRNPDISAIFYRKYDIAKGCYVDLK